MSAKDRVLLTRIPHLVLDGALVSAHGHRRRERSSSRRRAACSRASEPRCGERRGSDPGRCGGASRSARHLCRR